MKVQLKYGKGHLDLEVPEKNYKGTLKPNQVSHPLTGVAEVERALKQPIGSAPLKEKVYPGDKVVIVTSDITRPMPTYLVLPPVLKILYEAGLHPEDITLVFALGSHREHTEEEKEALVGPEVYASGIRLVDSDMEDCVRLGWCQNGTPVDIFRPVAEADCIICLGNIEYHYFAGYSGGAKALMPGVSSHEAIQANHSNMVKPQAYAGNLETNPVRQDVDEAGKFIQIDFIVNVVLNEKKEIVSCVAGHYLEAHRVGCKILDAMYGVAIPERAEIVVISPGGYPKDLNIYQAQKGLDNAKHAVKDGGIIIWVASAKEGFGEDCFERWMTTMKPEAMIEEIKKNFQLGGHKAAAIALVMEKARIFMVSDLEEALVRSIHLEPYATVQAAFDAALAAMGPEAGVLVMPDAGSTLPIPAVVQ